MRTKILLAIIAVIGSLAAATLAAARFGVALAPTTTFTLTQKWQRCPAWYCETGWYASPAVVDVDQDGQVDALWGGYTLMAVNGSTGTIEWNRPRGSSERLWPGIVVADLDHNGTLEVITASGNGIISVYNANGTPLSGWPVNPTGTGNELRSLAVADIDHNNDLEIVVCSTRPDNQWFVYEHTARCARAGLK